MIAIVAAAAIAGTVQQGQKLTATADAGATYQWYRCAPDVSHCSSIHGAKAATYALGAKDVGKVLALNVKGADGTAGYAPGVGPVAAAAAKLVATTQPKVTGDATVGKVLTVDNGAWSARTKGFTYAWLRCNANGRICVSIAGATGTTYVSTADDVGHALAVRVTASSGAVAQPTLSTVSAVVAAPSGPVASVAPAVSGTAQSGQRLVATPGTWTGSGTVAITYQWYRCDLQVSHCSSIHGATAAGYKLTDGDVGKTLALTVKAKDAVATVSVFLPAIGAITARTATLASTVQPKVTAAGTRLSVDDGSWSSTPTTFTYQWFRCNANGRICVPIAAATQQAYTPTADDQGHSLVATVDGVLSTRT